MSIKIIMATIWLVLFILMVIIEFISQGITTIWFAGGAVVALFASALGGPVWLQAALFFVVSIVLLIFTRPVLLKHYNNRLTKTNVETVVGEIAVVQQTINNLESSGMVVLNGMEWTARTENNNDIIPVGEKVIVKKVEGVKLIVEKGE